MQTSHSLMDTISHVFSFNFSRSRNAYGAISPCLRKTPDCTQTCPDYVPGCDQDGFQASDGNRQATPPLL